MVGENVELRVTLVDRRNTARELARIDTALQRTGSSASRAGRMAALGSRGFDRMSAGVRGLAGMAGRGLVAGLAAGGAAIAGLTYWVGKGATSLQRIQRIGAQTNAVIKSTGGVANVTRDSIDGLAGRLEALTGTEAESITEGANFLLTFTNIRNGVGKGNKVFDDTVRVLTDMTRALDNTGASTLDTRKQALQLGKALNDPVKGMTALTKVGVSFTEQQKKQVARLVENGKTMKAQKLILAELKKEFGGSAAAFGETDTGKIERFKHAIGTLQETLAATFAPVMGDMATQLEKKGVPALERWGRTWNQTVVPNVRAGIRETRALWKVYREDGTDELVRRIETLTGTQGKLTPILDKAREVMSDLGRIITGSLVPAFTGNSGAIMGMLSPLRQVDDVIGFFADHADLTKNIIIVLVGALTAAKVATITYAAYTKAAAIATGIHSAAVALSTSTFGTRIGVMAIDFAAWVRSTAATIANTAATVAWRAIALAGAAATGVVTAAQWLLNAAMSANPIGLVIAGIVLLVAGLVLAYKKSETFRKIVDTAFRMIKSVVLSVVGWFGKWVPQVFSAVVGAVKAYVTTYVNVIRTAFNIAKSVITTVLNTVKSVIGGIWGGIVRVVRTYINLYRTVITTAFNIVRSTISSAMGFVRNVVTGAFNKVKTGAESVRSFVVGKFTAVVGFFRKLPGRIASATSGLWNGIKDSFRGVLNTIIGWWNNFSLSIDIPDAIPGLPDSFTINTPNIGYLEKGGPALAGRPYIVGEKRPELFVPDTNGFVFPRLDAFTRSAGSDGTSAAMLELDAAMNGGDQTAPLREAITIISPLYIDGREVARAVHRADRDKLARV